jgi:hypothetical protein
MFSLRGRRHVSESQLRTNRHTIPCTICTQTEKGSYSFSVTHYNGLFTHFSQNKKILAGHLWQQIVHRIVWGFVWKIARVDGP